jgi:hypothetical protein
MQSIPTYPISTAIPSFQPTPNRYLLPFLHFEMNFGRDSIVGTKYLDFEDIEISFCPVRQAIADTAVGCLRQLGETHG